LRLDSQAFHINYIPVLHISIFHFDKGLIDVFHCEQFFAVVGIRPRTISTRRIFRRRQQPARWLSAPDVFLQTLIKRGRDTNHGENTQDLRFIFPANPYVTFGTDLPSLPPELCIVKIRSMKKILFIIAILISGLVNAQSLSENEKAGILLMREEEKMARDIYQTLNEKWDQMPFSHISESEIRHMAGMKLLIDKYKLQDPVEKTADKRGLYENQLLKSLYEELTASGKTSLEAAFRAGAKVEEVDIRDLKEAMARTSNEEIKSTYTYLVRASENHLRAFVRNLKRLNVDYTPVLMDKAAFDTIISGKHGGGMGKGNGNGQCQCCEKNSLR
jgi:hypothetical protein